MYTLPRFMTSAVRKAKTDLKRFKRDEDGVFIVFSLFVLISMLVLGGMAVDFVRQENNRIVLQGVADRSVLSAASLDQTFDGDVLVEDYFLKSGRVDSIVGTPFYEATENSKRVEVVARDEIPTFFLKLAGIDTLGFAAAASAVEAVGKVEISLVVDVSASMRSGGSRGTIRDTTTSIATGGRIGDLRDAAISFADAVLDPIYAGQVSLNIIPFAGHTNPGPSMYSFLNDSPVRPDTFDDFDDVPFDAIIPGRENPIAEIVWDDETSRFVLVVDDEGGANITTFVDVLEDKAAAIAAGTYTGPYPLLNSRSNNRQIRLSDGTQQVNLTNEHIEAIVRRNPQTGAGNPTFIPWDPLDPDPVDGANVILNPGVGNSQKVIYSPPHSCMEMQASSDYTNLGPPASNQGKLPNYMIYSFAKWEIEEGVRNWG